MERTFYVDQIPLEPFVVKVTNEKRLPRSLAAYSSAQLFVSTSADTYVGAATITDSANGVVTHTFDTSPFPVKGEAQIQLKLSNGARADYTEIFTVRVVESLEE